jgi:hypothetical protein
LRSGVFNVCPMDIERKRMISEILFNKSGITSSLSMPVNGTALFSHMPKSNRGIIDVSISNVTGTSGNTFIACIQGRLSDDQEFVNVLLNDTESEFQLTTAVTAITFEDIQLFPQMRAQIVSCSFASVDFLVRIGH